MGCEEWAAPWEEVTLTLEIPYPAAAEGHGPEAGDGFLKPSGLPVVESLQGPQNHHVLQPEILTVTSSQVDSHIGTMGGTA